MLKQTFCWTAIVAASAFAALAEETVAPAPAPNAEIAVVAATAETVVATVNGVPITLGHMLVAIKTLPAQYQSLADDVLFNGILDQIIQQQALAAEAAKNVTLRDRLVMENEARAYLAGAVLDDAALAALTDEAVKAAYDARVTGFAPGTEYNAAHVLVETEDEAKAVLVEALAGVDFTALAKARSTGPSGANGGDLGWFSVGMMVKPFEDAVVTMQPGEIKGPVQTEFGWHVIKLNETRISVAPPLEDLRAEIEDEIQQEAARKRLDEIAAAAVVTRSVEGIDPAIIRNDALLGN